MKLMGIDYGLRRIGIATSDPDGNHVRGLTTIDQKKNPNPYTPLQNLIIQEKIEKIVIGLPLGIDDEETEMSARIKKFGEKLRSLTNIEIVFVDESYTSKRVAELMRFRKKKDRQDKAAIDRLAACLILEHYIQTGITI